MTEYWEMRMYSDPYCCENESRIITAHSCRGAILDASADDILPVGLRLIGVMISLSRSSPLAYTRENWIEFPISTTTMMTIAEVTVATATTQGLSNRRPFTDCNWGTNHRFYFYCISVSFGCCDDDGDDNKRKRTLCLPPDRMQNFKFIDRVTHMM